ncbi:uncharacterized protein PHALS_00197 [Plasmopara halstedii]|uniref:Uncharacterized protein n=1 Tax=Plasmopara halstedii TaxID=4781 RepID=A0A0P1A6R0_PLAHL|nr:uncharacterized protein PHALS_00197 [Plasmopara halstedii]CEG35869.1 hypothetical protein PHALS_00197 [Plasmopara halstedii]|eukprot:XP_024572238.1 hypothetical protein PHALS_00197 [Plasmopara halstedii]
MWGVDATLMEMACATLPATVADLLKLLYAADWHKNDRRLREKCHTSAREMFAGRSRKQRLAEEPEPSKSNKRTVKEHRHNSTTQQWESLISWYAIQLIEDTREHDLTNDIPVLIEAYDYELEAKDL